MPKHAINHKWRGGSSAVPLNWKMFGAAEPFRECSSTPAATASSYRVCEHLFYCPPILCRELAALLLTLMLKADFLEIKKIMWFVHLRVNKQLSAAVEKQGWYFSPTQYYYFSCVSFVLQARDSSHPYTSSLQHSQLSFPTFSLS